VTTTLPATIHIASEGKIERAELGPGSLQGTLFEREFQGLLSELAGKQVAKVNARSFSIYLIWHEALRLKLKADWLEPAHFQRVRVSPEVVTQVPTRVRPEVQEPAHWFNGEIGLMAEEGLHISALDEVYPDLKLAERITVARRETMRLGPGVREPAHFRQIAEDLINVRAGRRLGPGVQEPAHVRRPEELEREDALRLVTDIAAVFRRHGL
jgi:hypothetical protein